jgi:hypothetical protein
MTAATQTTAAQEFTTGRRFVTSLTKTVWEVVRVWEDGSGIAVQAVDRKTGTVKSTSNGRFFSYELLDSLYIAFRD